MGGDTLGKKDKLIERLLSRPKDFTFDELVTLMGHFNFHIQSSGKTGGSRVTFINDDDDDSIRFHRPHPRKELHPYQVEDAIVALSERDLI